MGFFEVGVSIGTERLTKVYRLSFWKAFFMTLVLIEGCLGCQALVIGFGTRGKSKMHGNCREQRAKKTRSRESRQTQEPRTPICQGQDKLVGSPH